MSSEETNKHRSTESHSGDAVKEKKVCFICGSHTIFIVNIHEPRSGPNMIDVISEKFKMRPLNDDKFLCYSCNNWLINWYSMQNKYDRQNETDSSSTASTARDIGGRFSGSGNTSSGGSSSNSSDRRSTKPRAQAAAGIRSCSLQSQYIETHATNGVGNVNELVTKLSQDHTHDTVSAGDATSSSSSSMSTTNTRTADDNNEILITATIQAVRSKLQKYLYCPNKRKRNESGHDDDGGDDDNTENIRNMPLTEFNHHRVRNDDCDGRSPKVRCHRPDRVSSPDAENRYEQVPTPQRMRHYKYCELCRRPLVQRTKNPHRRQHLATGKYQSRLRSKAVQICRKCKHSMHMHICNRLACVRPNRQHTRHAHNAQHNEVNCGNGHSRSRSSERIQQNDILTGSNIVNKLKLLGTTIHYETNECVNQSPQFNVNDSDCHSISSMDETDTSSVPWKPSVTENHSNTQNQRPTINDANEIVLTFNTVVTEVFPMQLFSDDDGDDYAGNDQTPATAATTTIAATLPNARTHKNFHEIIKNVPKSLTITLA